MAEPGSDATDWLARGSRRSAESPAHAAVRQADGVEFEVGDPVATQEAVLEIVDAPEPPSRVILGRFLPDIEAIDEEQLATWRRWQPLSLRAFGSQVGAARSDASGSTPVD